MKQIYSLLLAGLFTATLTAQELIPNGGFEGWSEGIPTNWTITIPENGGSVEQSTDAHSGSSSAQMTAPLGTGNVRLSLTDFDIIPGTSYTISYWYKDESNDARFRHWFSWRDTDGAQLETNLDVLQPQEYNENSNGWKEFTLTLTAPANASKFRVEFRNYREGDIGGGSILLDDVSFKGPNMSTSDLNTSKVSMTTVWNNTANFNTKGIALVEIFNLNGQLVQKASGNNNFELNVANLAKGIYVVKVTVDGVATTQKVVKK